MNSAKHGKSTLAEVTNISRFGMWLIMKRIEYFLPFDKYPWFKKAIIEQIQNLEATKSGHLYWPDLDVDLHTDILEDPDKYPLQANIA